MSAALRATALRALLAAPLLPSQRTRSASTPLRAPLLRLALRGPLLVSAPVLALASLAPPLLADPPGPTVRFTTPGPKTVTLTVCNARGCSSIARRLTVLDPAPAIAAFSVAPPRAEIGATLLLEASATGQPSLAFSWQVLRGGALEAVFSGPSAAWSTAGSPPGLHTVRLIVSNASGSAGAAQDVLLVPAEGSRFFTVPPCRLLDTRAGAPLRAGDPPLPIAASGRCALPPTARALAAHATVVAPTAAGFLSLFPADLPRAVISSVNFAAGATRGNSLVLPLSTDGAARLAASLALVSPGTAHLVLDVAGYFQPAAPPPAAPVELAARLCAFGFCAFGAGTRVFFTEAFSSTAPALYRYDWLGTGAFDPPSAAPVTSHLYDRPGLYFPTVQVTSAGATSTLAAAAPLFVNPSDPATLPPAPTGVSAAFAGFATFSTVDPTLAGTRPSYRLAVADTPINLLGYNVYLSKNGAPWRHAAALRPSLPATEPLLADPFDPAADTLRLRLTALNFAGEGPPSEPLALSHP